MDKTRLAQLFQHASQIHRAGDPASAEPIYQEIIQFYPDFADIWHLWGIAAQEMGHHEQAVERFVRAIGIGGEQADSLHCLGRSYQALGRLTSALNCLNQALEKSPGNPHIMASLGLLAQEEKAFQRAESWYLQALSIQETFPQIHFNLGTLCREQSRNTEAKHHFQRALALDPGHWKAHFNLGLIAQLDNQTQQAIDYYEQALRLKPDYWRAHWAMLLVLPTCFSAEEEIIPARNRWLAGVEELSQNFHPQQAKDLEETRHACESTTNFHLHYQGQNDLSAQIAQGRLMTRIAHLVFPGYDQPLSCTIPKAGEKIHVAFVSSFLHGHSIFKTHSGFIIHMDHKLFFVSVFYTGTIQDESLKRVREGSDAFHAIGAQSHLLIEAIRVARPDILIYTDLGMDPMLNLVSALRLAPIQINAGGHPITSGLANMDYFLSSDAMELPHAQAHYSETLIRLPNLAHCYPTPRFERAEPPAGSERLPGDVIYCNLQNLIKLLPRHDGIYPAIAREIPNARFWFIVPGENLGTTFRTRLERAFGNLGLDYETHCRFFPPLGHYQFFGLIQAADIILDGIAWSGNNSSMEALAFDKPIVTLPGETFRSRHTYGILTHLGITATQAQDLDHFIAIAIRLGKDIAFRTEVSRTVAAEKHRLYNDQEPVRGLEKALVALVG
ncbi:MAG: tetratricopeptide repeat protein [Nitrospirae bacterium]|nr:tetratricopeptide repeat protein [Magnetococcales bacterium]